MPMSAKKFISDNGAEVHDRVKIETKKLSVRNVLHEFEFVNTKKKFYPIILREA